jgi:16S rRNA (uracil1498-N3)-methyltransferase
LNLILFESCELREGAVTVQGTRAEHLIHVLRVIEGQVVRIGLLDGPVGMGTVVSVADGHVDLHCAFEGTPRPRPAVDLLLALPRPKVMRRLWAQLAALGVDRIVLTNADRVERDYFDTHILREETYRPLLVEGLQQARDTALPRVSIHKQFRALVEDELDALVQDSARIAAHAGENRSLRTAVKESGRTRALLAVGPEGGWNDFELRLLEAHGFRIADAGPRTLRSDTACVALVALVHDALGS